jgi:hypothetical protein
MWLLAEDHWASVSRLGDVAVLHYLLGSRERPPSPDVES